MRESFNCHCLKSVVGGDVLEYLSWIKGVSILLGDVRMKIKTKTKIEGKIPHTSS